MYNRDRGGLRHLTKNHTRKQPRNNIRSTLAVLVMPKGTCPAEVTPNREKNKLIALVVVELHLAEGISNQAVRKPY